MILYCFCTLVLFGGRGIPLVYLEADVYSVVPHEERLHIKEPVPLWQQLTKYVSTQSTVSQLHTVNT